MAKRVGVLTGGGTAPGWNAAIQGAAEAAEEHNYEMVGIPYGYSGLMAPNQIYKHLVEHIPGGVLSDLLLKPGSVLGSSRDTPFPKNNPNAFETVRQIIEENIERNRLDLLIAIGGDDTFKSTQGMVERGMIDGNAVPKTIDNDITHTLCFGHITAGEVGKRVVEEMRVEAEVFRRVAIIEAMGRYASWLASLHEGAHIILPAEFEIPQKDFIRRMEEVLKENNGSGIVVVAEGFQIDGKQTFQSPSGELDPHGHGKLGGVRLRIQQWLKEADIDASDHLPGYRYRNGPPTEEDATLARRLGYASMEAAAKGKVNMISVAQGHRGSDIVVIDMNQVSGGKVLPRSMYNFEILKPTISHPIAEIAQQE
ncbi:hypothetical protein COU76_01685 [Candidatus Peregrinibacteria bacterium CG10_big_fil_rev_8_21_14_0_10_49_10]|nr:MAG: hypothetical protein COU76_01685 [Candidatus Peregrinibacteria bacterium CG10_big_fil_rev_8_21_14_0_10_49_10]